MTLRSELISDPESSLSDMSRDCDGRFSLLVLSCRERLVRDFPTFRTRPWMLDNAVSECEVTEYDLPVLAEALWMVSLRIEPGTGGIGLDPFF